MNGRHPHDAHDRPRRDRLNRSWSRLAVPLGFAFALVLSAPACASGPTTPTPREPDVVVPFDPTQPDAGLIDPADLPPVPKTTCLPREWPLWETYKTHFMEADGRVVDHFAKHSTSEGQAYGMFLALVARDQKAFAKIFDWANRFLAKGNLGLHLPAWKWGDKGGRQQVVDPNAASDADLFMAYALVHAASAFGVDEYARLGGRLLALIEAREVVDIAGLGPMMLPGPIGFEIAQGFRFNQSYLALPLVRWAGSMSKDRKDAPWTAMIEATVVMAEGSTPNRLYADWIIWDKNARRFVADTVLPPLGSYDAIRAYLWPAVMPADDPLRGRLLARGSRLLELVRTTGFVPEKVHAWSGEAADQVVPTPGPVGFEVVAQVFATAMGDERLAASLGRSIAEKKRPSGLYGDPAFYYDHNLLLFAQGFLEGRYAFRADGGLVLPREGDPCSTP